MQRVFLVRAHRTPIGKFFGGLSRVSVADLGIPVVRKVTEGLEPGSIDELIFGCARQAGQGPNPARQIALRADLGEGTAAQTINMACGSGLKAIWMAAEAIQVGRADIIVAGGAESMTQVPFMLDRMRTGYRLGHGKLIDGMYRDGFQCPLADQVMGLTAETLADKYEISRVEQDEFAVGSQAKAAKAIEEGAFDAEIVPVDAPKGVVVSLDEHVRPGTTMEKIAKLPPVFRDDGTVHAGNSSGITDGAPASPTARRHCSSRRSRRSRSTAGRRWRSSRAARARASIRASWASARYRRRRTCSARSAGASATSISSS
jgi:acetyl-CoA C-acetyltransferase